MIEGPFKLSENNTEPEKDEIRRKLNHWSRVAAIAAAGMKTLTSVIDGGKLTDADIEDINREGNRVEMKSVFSEKKIPEIYEHRGPFENDKKVEVDDNKD